MQLDDEDDDAIEAERLELESRAAHELEQALGEQLDRIVPTTDLPRSEQAAAVSRNLETMPRARLQQVLTEQLASGARLGVRLAVDQLHNAGIGFNWQLANIDAMYWASSHAFETEKKLDEVTKRRIAGILADWIEGPNVVGSLRDALTPWFGAFRAERISSTEITRAFAEGTRRAYERSGVVQRIEWLTSADDEVCPICRPLAGKTGPLATGIADVGFPPAHSTCRCRIAGIVEGA